MHTPELRHAGPHEAGLFHTAILFDTEAALAAAVYSVAQKHPGTFTGSSDHLVSKAFYFDDPEGNGVELYWDRDRSEWSWVHGTIEMGTLFLDPNAFLQEHLTEEGARRAGSAATPGSATCTSRSATSRRAREFYVDRLGFDATIEHPRPGALRERGRLPPPHGDERLEQPRRRPPPARPSASAGSTSWCPPPTTSARSASG